VTAVEAYELASRGGASGFARVIAACESCGAYCLIGGLVVNYYVESAYTLDADIVGGGGGLEWTDGKAGKRRVSN
jgi:hypothetical protein